jgi:hypothetical protein
MDVRGVVPGGRDSWEELVQQPGANIGQLIQYEPAACELREDREQPGPRRGLKRDIGRSDRGRRGGSKGKLDRRGELLQCLALLGSACMRGQKSSHLDQHLQCARRGRGLGADSWTELAEEQDGRGLAGVVGCLPVPGTGRIGAAEGALHGIAQCDRVDTLAALEMRQEKTRGVDEAMGGVGYGASVGEQRRICSRWSGSDRHGEDLGEREQVEPRSAL